MSGRRKRDRQWSSSRGARPKLAQMAFTAARLAWLSSRRVPFQSHTMWLMSCRSKIVSVIICILRTSALLVGCVLFLRASTRLLVPVGGDRFPCAVSSGAGVHLRWTLHGFPRFPYGRLLPVVLHLGDRSNPGLVGVLSVLTACPSPSEQVPTLVERFLQFFHPSAFLWFKTVGGGTQRVLLVHQLPDGGHDVLFGAVAHEAMVGTGRCRGKGHVLGLRALDRRFARGLRDMEGTNGLGGLGNSWDSRIRGG